MDTSPSLTAPYTLWSGLIGGLFLMLSYFGCDQSQVQRYLSGSSLTQSRLSLLFNAFLKVPMQFLILLTGVLVFVFYHFQRRPLLWNAVELRAAGGGRRARRSSPPCGRSFEGAHAARRGRPPMPTSRNRDAPAAPRNASGTCRPGASSTRCARRCGPRSRRAWAAKHYNDTNYIFPSTSSPTCRAAWPASSSP